MNSTAGLGLFIGVCHFDFCIFKTKSLPLANVYTPPPRTLMEIFENLPEGTFAQLINNQIVMSPAPSNTHQKVLDKIYRELGNFVEKHSLGETRPAPFDVFLNRKNAYQPDIIFIANSNMDNLKENGFYGAPDLVIEVHSPATEQHDRGVKKEVYEKTGVKEYWMIDPVTKMAEGCYLENNAFLPLNGGVGIMNLKLIDLVLRF